MTKWYHIKRWIIAHFQQMTNRHILYAVLIYIVLSWIIFSLVGEEQLIHSTTDFFYYLIVTASTVGYGDLSPQTSLGKWIVALFIIPVGLSIFAVAVGRIATITLEYWRSGLKGKRNVKVTDHILILGWNEQRTIHLIEMLLHEEKNKRPIVLCVRADIENPMPKSIDFVRATSFTDQNAMFRAGIERANCIIIDNQEDDVTFAAALFCASINPKAHILAYFQDEILSQLLKTHCPNAECVPSVSIEMIAKSAVDPGSSELHHELLNTKKGMTQYAVIYPAEQTTIGQLFLHLKQTHDATLIGIRKNNQILLNPALSQEVQPNDLLFYIADERIERFQWQNMS